MNAEEIIRLIRDAEKKTPVKLYLGAKEPMAFPNCTVFGAGDQVIFGEWKDIEPVLRENAERVERLVVECDRRNSAIPLKDLKGLNARVEPGAILRDMVEIGERAVIMMGAVVAAGSVVIGDMPPNAVVAGVPAKIIKMKDEKTEKKTALVDALRNLQN